MKRSFLIICSLTLLFSCSGVVETTNDNLLSSFNESSNTSSSFEEWSSTSSFEISNESSSANLTEETNSSSISNSTFDSSSTYRKDSPTPLNKDNKIVLSETATEFEFNNGMPDYFRPIWGYQYKGEYYSSGQLKITSHNEAKQGFQTGMFVSDKKLEIRLQIGEMHRNQKTNIEKNKPILEVTGFDENGNEVSKMEVLEKNFPEEDDQNKMIRLYMYPATNVAYLEVIAVQLPYHGSKSYNFGFKGIDLVSWPYDMK